MTDKRQVQENIKKLIEKYERVKSTHQLRKYSEADTRREFVMPLFQTLGWDVYNDFSRDVQEEVDAVRGTVDYSFLIEDIPKFVVEAKALKVDLEKVEWAKQVINYGWNKNIPWVILTDFEGLKLFNSEWKKETPHPNKEFTYKEYISRLDELWLFSKESIEDGRLDKTAVSWGILAKREDVSEKLAKDLIKWRDLLTSNLKQWNRQIKDDDIDEAVQRILDRLIFIRTCEDRQLEPSILWPSLQRWLKKGHKPYNFMEELIPVFRQIDNKYNSNLFLPHSCEKLDTEGDPFEKIINDLYADKESGVKYRFDKINADVLGAIYEQYLGHVQTKKEGDESKRKKQGIYYTPAYIVDYIVQNTLGKLLKETTSLIEKEKIKILDPACGSGSFLIKAFEIMDGHLKEARNHKADDHNQAALRKYRILTENIYGVDLDEQAIEIARLNLLLKALVPKHKLPLLTEHMKTGNSLISGNEQSLKPYFGSKWQEQKLFNWEEEFPDVFKRKNPGFDVIIGNPPYVRPEKVDKDERNYYINSGSFERFFGRFDLYILFIEKALRLLRQNGYFTFIIPHSFFNQNYSKKLREWILTSFRIEKILDLSEIKVFKSATVQTSIIVIKKSKPDKNHKISISRPASISEFKKKDIFFLISQRIFLKFPQCMIRTDISKKDLEVADKIKKQSIKVSDICYVVIGAVPHHSKTGASKDRLLSKVKRTVSQKKYIEGKDIDRYKTYWRNTYLDYQPFEMHRPKFPELFENKKLIVRNISTTEGLIATLDEKNYFTNDTVSLCVPWDLLENVDAKGVKGTGNQILNSQKYSLLFVLALINSKVLNFYFKKILSSTLHVYPEAIRKLPIYEVDFSVHSEKESYAKIAKITKQILDLNKKHQSVSEDTDKWYKLKTEIERLDKKIDKEVYKLYHLTPEEIKIVEGKK